MLRWMLLAGTGAAWSSVTWNVILWEDDIYIKCFGPLSALVLREFLRKIKGIRWDPLTKRVDQTENALHRIYSRQSYFRVLFFYLLHRSGSHLNINFVLKSLENLLLVVDDTDFANTCNTLKHKRNANAENGVWRKFEINMHNHPL